MIGPPFLVTQQSQTTLGNSYLRLDSPGNTFKDEKLDAECSLWDIFRRSPVRRPEGRIGQREKLCAAEVSANPTGALELGWPF